MKWGESEQDHSLGGLQAHTEILRSCSGTINKATLRKSGLLGERGTCKTFLLLSKAAMTYYADLQENKRIKLNLKNALSLQMLPSCQQRLAPHEERLISNRLLMCSLRRWEFRMRPGHKLFIWGFFSFYFRTPSRLFLSEFLPGPIISKCRQFSVKKPNLNQDPWDFTFRGVFLVLSCSPFSRPVMPSVQLRL